MKSVILAALAVVLLSSCTFLNSASQIAVAATELPHCRQALIDFANPETTKLMAPDFKALDNYFDKVISVVDNRPEISLDSVEQIIDAPDTADAIEGHYNNIQRAVIMQGDVTEEIKSCNTRLQQAWTTGRDSDQAGSARKFLRDIAPIAKAGLKILPLLISNEGDDSLVKTAL